MFIRSSNDPGIKDFLHNIISTYGETAQIDIAIEEMSELTKALLKKRRYDNRPHKSSVSNLFRDDVIEEIADVGIMLEQLIMIFDCETEVKEQIMFKLNRQNERMKSGG